MTARRNETSFTYPIYIQATPEQVWQGLTDPAFMRRYWRHQRAGEKTFRSDWKKGSTYAMEHEEWASTGLTDIHHQGHTPGKDVQNGDHGEEEAASASLVHSGVQG